MSKTWNMKENITYKGEYNIQILILLHDAMVYNEYVMAMYVYTKDPYA